MMHVESDILIIAPAIAGVVVALSSLIYFCFLKESSGSRETAKQIDEFASILAGTSNKNDSKDAKNKKKTKNKNLGRQQSQQQQNQTQQQSQGVTGEKKQQKRDQRKQTNIKPTTTEEKTEDDTAAASVIGNLSVERVKEELLEKAQLASEKLGQVSQNVREASTVAANKAATVAQHAKEDLLAKAQDVGEKVATFGQKTIDAACEVLPAGGLANVSAKVSASVAKVQQQTQKLVKAASGGNEDTKNQSTGEAETNVASSEKPANSAGDVNEKQSKSVKNKKQQPDQTGKTQQTNLNRQSSTNKQQQNQSKSSALDTLAPLNIPVASDGSFTITNSALIATGKLPTAPGQLNQLGKAQNSKQLHPGMVLAASVADSSRNSSISSSDEQQAEQLRRVNALFQKKPANQQSADSLSVSASTPATTGGGGSKPVHAVGAVGENNAFRSQSRQSNLPASFAENSDPVNEIGSGSADIATKRPRNNKDDKSAKSSSLQSKPVNGDVHVVDGVAKNNNLLEEHREETTTTTTTMTKPAVVRAAGAAAGAATSSGRRKANFKNMNGVSSSAVNEDVQQIGELIMATNLTTEDYARLSRIVTEKGASVYGEEWFESNKKGAVRQTQTQQPALVPGFAAYLLHQKEQDLENEHKLVNRHTQQIDLLQKQNQQLSHQLNEIRTKSQTEAQHVRQQYEQTMQSRSVEIQHLKEQLQTLAPQLSDAQRLRAELSEKTSQFEKLRQLQVSSAQQYEREKQQLLRELHNAKQEANEQRSRDIEQAQQQLHEQHQQELQALQQQAHAQEIRLQQQLSEMERALREREAEAKRIEERTQHQASDTVEKLNAQLQEQVQQNKLLERQLSELHSELDTTTARHQSTISTTEEKVRQLEQQIEQREREWQKTSSEDKAEVERLRKQVDEVASQVPSEDLRKNVEQKQNEVDRLTARVKELEQENKKQAGEAAEIRDKSRAELDAARQRAEQAEARIVAIEQQLQQTIETNRQQQQQRIAELETANQKLEADLKHMRETDERRSTQIKELKENSRRIRQEMEEQQKQQQAAVALNMKDSVTSTESSEFEMVNHNNNGAESSALLREQIEAVNVLRNEVLSAEKLVSKLETECRELVDAHSSQPSSGAAENGDAASTTVITKRVTTVTTESQDIPLSSNEGESLVEAINLRIVREG